MSAGVVIVLATGSVAYGEPLVGAGDSAEGEYVAVAATGEARSSKGVAVSGLGTAHGGIAGVTVAGGATGGTAGVDPDALTGSAKRAAYVALENADIYYHTGLNTEPTAYQATYAALFPATAATVADKATRLARYADTTRTMLATGITGPPPPPGVPTAPPPPCATCMSLGIKMFDTAWSPAIAGKITDGCVPAAALMAWYGQMMPSQEVLAKEMGTQEGVGTWLKNVAPAVRKFYLGSSAPFYDYAWSPDDLMAKLAAMVSGAQQGVLVGGDFAFAHWPRNRQGTPHSVAIIGYWLYNFGHVLIVDPYNQTRWGTSNPFGHHWIDLMEVWAAITYGGQGDAAELVW